MTGKNAFGKRPEKASADIPIVPLESFVNSMYASVDEAAARGLDRLRNEDGIIPTCELGCSHCCRFYIVTNPAEAYTLAKYVRRELSADQISDLRMQTQQWHEWENSRPGRYPSASTGEETDFADYDHSCPLLVNGTCSVYPVRPVVCRTHFVCSPPLCCDAVNDPESTEDAPEVLSSIVTESNPFSTAIRDRIENTGLDFSRSLMLLPHGLAIEMGWDFAISPWAWFRNPRS